MLLGLRRQGPCANVVSMSSGLGQAPRPLRARAVPADALLHPVAALAVVTLVLNDHVGKAMWPGTVTGKLSDIAGLVFFPLVLVGLWEVGLSGLRRWGALTTGSGRGRRSCHGFGLHPRQDNDHRCSRMGRSPWRWSLDRWDDVGNPDWLKPELVPVVVVRDATDLIALPAILVAVWIGVKRARSEPRSRSELPRPQEWAAR